MIDTAKMQGFNMDERQANLDMRDNNIGSDSPISCAVAKDTTAKEAFKARVQHWAEKLDVQITWLGVRPMRNKWASCSTNGVLNFSNDLLPLDRKLWDYVIVHELLHFFVPNHGKLWKSLMRAHLGDYEEIEIALKHLVKKPTCP